MNQVLCCEKVDTTRALDVVAEPITTGVLLSKGGLRSFDLVPGHSLNITVLHGEVWATMEGDSADYVLFAGDSLRISASGRLVVEAFSASEIHVELNAWLSAKTNGDVA